MVKRLEKGGDDRAETGPTNLQGDWDRDKRNKETETETENEPQIIGVRV